MASRYSSASTAVHTKQTSPVELPKGVRTVKYYMMSKAELFSIGAACWLSAIFFSVAAGLFAFIGGVQWDYAMIEQPTASQRATTDGVLSICWMGVWIALAIAICLTVWRLLVVGGMKKEHRFSEATIQSGH